jgi:hypothetical protein
MEVETGEMDVLDNVNASPTCEGSDVASDFESGRNKRAKAPCNNKQCRSYTPRLSGSESCCGRDKREEPKINQGESHTAVVSTQSKDEQLHSRRCRTLPSPRRRRAHGQTGTQLPVAAVVDALPNRPAVPSSQWCTTTYWQGSNLY